jgi:hypothetical protein
MHTASKVVLGLGVIITILGMVSMGLGGAEVGDLDLDIDGKELYSGEEGGNFESLGVFYAIQVYAVGSNETIDCDTFADQITITNQTSEEVFFKDCNADENDESDKTFLGSVFGGHPDSFAIGSSTGEVKVIAYGISGGDARQALFGLASIISGIAMFCCGILFLIVGLIMSLTMKDSKQKDVTFQPVGQTEQDLIGQ